MPNPVSLEFQEYSSGPSGANRDHLRNQFGTRSYRCQIRLAWIFRYIPEPHRDKKVITSEFNRNPVPSGPNCDHLRNHFGTRSHRDQIRLAWIFRCYSRVPSGPNRDHLRKKFGSRPLWEQILFTWIFRHIPVGHQDQTAITSEFNRNPVPSGPNPVSLEFQELFPGAIGSKP